jgi:hypothetical protein
MGKGEICNLTIGNNFHVSIHLMDFWNIWKRKDINYLLDLKGEIQPFYKSKHGLWYAFKKSFFFNWWTPVWHEGRGPYISIALCRLRFMRGY